MSQPDSKDDEELDREDDEELDVTEIETTYIPTRIKVTAIMTLMLVFIAGVGISVLYTERVHRSAEKRSAAVRADGEKRSAAVQAEAEGAWCGIIDIFLETYKTNPPTTPTGREVQRGFENLYRAYHCAGR